MASKRERGSLDASAGAGLTEKTTDTLKRVGKSKRPPKSKGRGTGTKGKRRGLSAKETANAAERAERMKEALEFRKAGYGYQMIADVMEISTSTAYVLVKEAIAMIPSEAAEEVRSIELDRLDAIQQRAWEELEQAPGAPGPIDTIFKCMDRRARYLNLYQDGQGGTSPVMDMVAAMMKMANADRPVLRPDAPVPANPVL